MSTDYKGGHVDDREDANPRGREERHDHSSNRAFELIALNLISLRKLLETICSRSCTSGTADINAILAAIAQLKEIIMATATELTADLKLVLAQQQKTVTEIQTLQSSVDTLNVKIVELEAIIAAGGEGITQELTDAVAEVKAQAQVVDDQIPDAPVPLPLNR